MFSPSLVSIMFHSFDREMPWSSNPTSYVTAKDIADKLNAIADKVKCSRTTIPVVARTRQPISLLKEYFSNEEIGSQSFRFDQLDPFSVFWGRFRLDRLVGYFTQFHHLDPTEELLDIGTPLFELGSGSPHDQTCRSLFQHAATLSAATVAAAIVDLGEEDIGCQPDDYGNKLRHAVTNDIKLSGHAEKVLSVLLERLDKNSKLDKTTVSCALVRPPTAFIGTGLSAFDQACSPEILTAIEALKTQLDADGLPVAVNLSLGTHVGPHNGESPLEEYIAAKLTKNDRYLVVAAGNEGGAGHSAKCTLEGDEPDYLSIRTGSLCEEMLVEFWWEDSAGISMSIDVDIWETDVTHNVGTRTNHATLRIDSSALGTLSVTPTGLPTTMIMQSLFGARCHNSLNCISFAITSTNKAALPVLDIKLRLQAQNAPATTRTAVNGWIVVAEADPLTAATNFIEGGAQGNVIVPASDPAVLSVAGLDRNGNVWKGSSRGPAAEYDTANGGLEVPLMAHLAYLGSEFGTSFASPRACADVIDVLIDPNRKCKDAKSLLVETYCPSGKLPIWNARFGFHKAQ
ncbi:MULTISPECIES: hypothetical protein [unclassified Rhizobium]|uniref:hypothetical protein n=1 Tax=unclassified Rhizobium TaxID=2613769 RepID=UPI00161AB094|nr:MULTISPECIES: hypothetical protein [unclassified Rhizobium]MBB3545341.1 hypothetical protein [Rhizobium sp. BK399]MCS4096054.1 hypothetical protein [Rhizobium sp. BK176]